MQEKYVVRDANNHYQASYNFGLGKDRAYGYAVETARRVCGKIFYLNESETNGEIELFNYRNSEVVL